jgi:5-methylcytosine-specific restriction endonuclease McrA
MDHRRPEILFTDAPRGTCRWCGETILHTAGEKKGSVDRRRRWHPVGADAYNATDPRELRRQVRLRDRGFCTACRLDTYALRRKLKGRGMAKQLRAKGFVPRRSLWEVDHVVPLIDGGNHDLVNLQTLCSPCHRRKSAQENRERGTRPRGQGAHGEARAADSISEGL